MNFGVWLISRGFPENFSKHRGPLKNCRSWMLQEGNLVPKLRSCGRMSKMIPVIMSSKEVAIAVGRCN